MVSSIVPQVLFFVGFLSTAVDAACEVDNLVLWNADTSMPIETLDNLGGVIDLCEYEHTALNIEVVTTCPVDVVKIKLTDDVTGDTVLTQVEGEAPYMLGGDINEPFSVNEVSALKTPGMYKLKANPTPGTAKTFSFTVKECPFVIAAPATEPVREIQANEDYKKHYLVRAVMLLCGWLILEDGETDSRFCYLYRLGS